MLTFLERLRIKARMPAVIEGFAVRRFRRQVRLNSASASSNDRVRQLLVDVSVICKNDAGTGIQRVVGALFKEMTKRPPEGYVICPIAATRKRPYRYICWRGAGESKFEGRIVEVEPGDLYFALDFSTHAVYGNRAQIFKWKQRGVEVGFFVHDLLPEHHPEWFSLPSVLSYRRWIKQVANLADFVICNSRNTKEVLLEHFHGRFGLSEQALRCMAIPLGWDIRATEFTKGLPNFLADLIGTINQRTSVLIVGTLEPRKGHDQLLSAFEVLWQRGRECNLIVVGRAGWKTEALQRRLKFHPHNGTMLHWFDNASDEALEQLYRACDGVVVASKGEGFGLPLIEALGHGKPVLARDLPIFRELGLEGVQYFSGASVDQLAEDLDAWVANLEAGQVIIGELPKYTWQESYREFMSACNLN